MRGPARRADERGPVVERRRAPGGPRGARGPGPSRRTRPGTCGPGAPAARAARCRRRGTRRRSPASAVPGCRPPPRRSRRTARGPGRRSRPAPRAPPGDHHRRRLAPEWLGEPGRLVHALPRPAGTDRCCGGPGPESTRSTLTWPTSRREEPPQRAAGARLCGDQSAWPPSEATGRWRRPSQTSPASPRPVPAEITAALPVGSGWPGWSTAKSVVGQRGEAPRVRLEVVDEHHLAHSEPRGQRGAVDVPGEIDRVDPAVPDRARDPDADVLGLPRRVAEERRSRWRRGSRAAGWDRCGCPRPPARLAVTSNQARRVLVPPTSPARITGSPGARAARQSAASALARVPAPPVLPEELVRGLGAPRAGRIVREVGRGQRAPRVQDRRRDAPGGLDHVRRGGRAWCRRPCSRRGAARSRSRPACRRSPCS